MIFEAPRFRNRTTSLSHWVWRAPTEPNTPAPTHGGETTAGAEPGSPTSSRGSRVPDNAREQWIADELRKAADQDADWRQRMHMLRCAEAFIPEEPEEPLRGWFANVHTGEMAKPGVWRNWRQATPIFTAAIAFWALIAVLAWVLG